MFEPIHNSAAVDPTVGELFETYYEQHLKVNARSHKWMFRAYELYWSPIKTLRAKDLTPLVVRAWLNELSASVGKTTANRQRTNLQSCLRWAAANEIIDAAVPMRLFLAVKKFRESGRETYLRQGDDFQRLIDAMHDETIDIQDALWLMLLTGQRRSNVLSMQWCELDTATALWTIPASKTKTQKTYTVALTPFALSILERRRGCHDVYVLPSCRDSQKGHLNSIQKAWGRVRTRAGLQALRIHDLRHSVATWLAMNGASAFEIQRALNHASVATSQRYVHIAAADSVRERLTAIQEQMGIVPIVPERQQGRRIVAARPDAKVASIKISPAEQVMIEGKIIACIRSGGNNKKAFYRRIPNIVSGSELERIISEMIERGLIYAFRAEPNWHTEKFGLCELKQTEERAL